MGEGLARNPSFAYQIYNFKFTDKLKLMVLTAV